MAAIYDSVPYMRATYRMVALPKTDSKTNRNGYGVLVFPMTNTINQSLYIINDKKNLVHNNQYYYYYYNLLYKGSIGGRMYNIKDMDKRKNLYFQISKTTKLHPHPIGMLDSTPNRNTFFEMSEYVQIFNNLSSRFSINKKIGLFWDYFKSIWFSKQTSGYTKKIVLINLSMVENFFKDIRKAGKDNNPLFILYYTMYKKPILLKDIDLDIVIYSDRYVLKINPSTADDKSYLKFRTELNKIFGRTTKVPENFDEEMDLVIAKDEVKNVLNTKYNFTGDKEAEKETLTELPVKKPTVTKSVNATQSNVTKKVNDAVDNIEKNVDKEVFNNPTDTEKAKIIKAADNVVKDEMDKDQALIDDIYKYMNNETLPKNNGKVGVFSSERDAKLRSNYKNIEVGNITLDKLSSINQTHRPIPVKDVSGALHTINDNVKKIKFKNINKDYIENIYETDIAKVLDSLPGFSIISIKKEDSSNELNYKETYRVLLEDDARIRHHLTFDVPKFIEDTFLYLGGNKKLINKQNFLYPVVKTAPDTVQIVTNYNKIFLRRVDNKSLGSAERIVKLISGNEEANKYFTIGSVFADNKKGLTTIEYDDISKVISEFKTNDCVIYFSIPNAEKVLEKFRKGSNASVTKLNKALNDNKALVFIGLHNKTNPILLDTDTQNVSVLGTNISKDSILEMIADNLPESLEKAFSKTYITKKLMFSTATIMGKSIPLAVLVVFWNGMRGVLNILQKYYGVKYEFSVKKPNLEANETMIRFSDCYLKYTQNLGVSILMNGLQALDTENYTIEDYDSTEAFVDFFKKTYGKVAIMNALNNYKDFLIDPITREVLDDLKLPQDPAELCIYGGMLLSDNRFTPEYSQTLSRIRSIEIIPAMLYEHLSSAYLRYKNSNRKEKVSIPKDAVLKSLMALQTVEDYSCLNPVVEMHKKRTVQSKGYRGINLERAYTEEKRSHDKSMVGIVAISTSPDKNVGITRFLTLEPNIVSARGYVDIKGDKLDELKDVNIFTAAELMYPPGNIKDDTQRLAIGVKQTGHVIPIKNATPALLSNGVDEAARFDLTSDFAVNADEDGSVIDYDEGSQVMIVQYKSGKKRAIDLGRNIVKNGGGGFYLSNQLVTNLKVGSKFKKDDILAWHKDFFSDDGMNGSRLCLGAFEKVAIMSSYNTYQDACVITEKMSRDMETAMTFRRQVVVGKNSNIYDMRKLGDHISIGDPLITFDTSFEDSELNKMLATLSEENKQTFEENAAMEIKSKFAGEIIDIKIYSAVELDEMSPSLRKIVSNYYNKVNKKKKFVAGHDDPANKSIVKCGLLLNETTGKIEPNIYGVIKGQKVEDSVLIEFYIEHGDILGIGDKLAFYTALKGIVSEVIPKGYEPWTEFRPEEELSSLIPPTSIIKRQVPSIIVTLFTNKIIVELKRKLEEIYKS